MKVLFIDDEPRVLSGMRRSLRSLRDDWDMQFCESGAEALEYMARHDCDVVVTDMRMPSMTGAELLKEIQTRYPKVIRIVLSGHSDVSAVISAFGVSHQYLAKPCDTDVLKQSIERTLRVRERLDSEHVRALVARIGTLPSLPEVYQKLLVLLQNPDSGQQEIAVLIEQDVSLSATMLKAVNTAYFGHDKDIKTVSRAISFLGLETLANMVLGNAAFRSFEVADIPGFSLPELYSHSFKVASIARHLVGSEERFAASPEDAYMAGMLHDIGRLVLASEQPDSLSQAMRHSREAGVALTTAEHDCIGVTHAELGAYLVSLWGFPMPVVEAIAFHELPGGVESPLVAAVHIAERLSRAAPDTDFADAALDAGVAAGFACAESWDGWLAWCHECEAAAAVV